MSNGPGRTPDAAGDFKKYPFPRLVFFLFKKKLLGHLALEYPGKWKGNVYFRDGVPVYTDIPSSHDVLGRVLLERGAIAQGAFDESLQQLAAGKGLQGQILLGMKALTEDQLVDGLKVQLHRKLMRLFPLTEVRFALYNGEHGRGTEAEAGRVRADPFWLVYNGVKHFFSHDRMAPELTRLQDRVVQLNPNFEETRHRFGFSDDEHNLLTYLARSPLSIAQILQASNLSPVETEMLVYTLWITEMLVISTQAVSVPAAAPAADPQPVFVADEPTPTPHVPEEAAAHPTTASATSAFVANAAAAGRHRKLVKETFEQIQEKNLYDVLGVAKNATDQQIRDAYFKLAKTFHPDKCNALGLQDVADKAEEIFRRISEANAVLTNKDNRKEYDEQLQGKASKKEVMNALEAEFIFQKGVFFLRKKDYEQALKNFEEAYALNSKEGEHLAYQAWTLFQDPKQNRVDIYQKAMDMLEDSLKISPRSAEVHYFIGEIYAAKGSDRKAVEYFNKTLEVNPDHLDAERHLRLIKIREDKRRAAAEKAKGFFGRLLSKKEDEKTGKGKKKPKKKWY